MDNAGKVLIADDEQLMVDLLDEVLKSAGFQTVIAANGREALEKIEREHPHLVLLDINMPEISGIEVLKRVREKPEYAALAIVMLTGKNEESQIVQAFESGADDYVPKPFDNEKLVRQVKVLIDKANKGELPSQSFGKKRK